MKQVFQAVIETPIGSIGIRTSSDYITGLSFRTMAQVKTPDNPLAQLTASRIKDYFQQGSRLDDLPVALDGTPFQRRVWQLLQEIASGSTRTYGDIARELGSSARAVGNACRANPIPLIVPCHRVVSATGIGGFSGRRSGERVEMKRWLLAHERAVV